MLLLVPDALRLLLLLLLLLKLLLLCSLHQLDLPLFELSKHFNRLFSRRLARLLV